MALSSDDPEQARVRRRQLPVFTREGGVVCRELGLSEASAKRLHRLGLLSFDPNQHGNLDEEREAELVFIGTLSVVGCPMALLRTMLRGLSKPYAYDLNRVYFDWPAGRWRLLPDATDPEELFFTLLEQMEGRNEQELLGRIRALTEDALDLTRDRGLFFEHENGFVRAPEPASRSS